MFQSWIESFTYFVLVGSIFVSAGFAIYNHRGAHDDDKS